MHRQLKFRLRADPWQEILGTVTEKQKDGIKRALAEMMVAYFEMIRRKESPDEKRKD